MAANGVVAHMRLTESNKLDGYGGFDISKSKADVAVATDDLHVLAVDDNSLDRKVIEQLLKVSSCKATVVDSGRRALQFLGLEEGEDNSSVEYNELKVDLIITDYCMPEMTGYELLKKIKESSTFKAVPVVIMSSEKIISRIDRCLEEGAEAFLMKPVKLADVKRLKDFMMAKGINVKVNADEKEAEPNHPVLPTTEKKRKRIEDDNYCTAVSSEDLNLCLLGTRTPSSPSSLQESSTRRRPTLKSSD